jgi:uracil phosphoribosyltransferase
MNKIVLKAEDLDGYLTAADKDRLERMDRVYQEVMDLFSELSQANRVETRRHAEEGLIARYNDMGTLMQEICREETAPYGA